MGVFLSGNYGCGLSGMDRCAFVGTGGYVLRQDSWTCLWLDIGGIDGCIFN